MPPEFVSMRVLLFVALRTLVEAVNACRAVLPAVDGFTGGGETPNHSLFCLVYLFKNISLHCGDAVSHVSPNLSELTLPFCFFNI